MAFQSPDGRQIAYVMKTDNTRALAMMMPDGTSERVVRQLTYDSAPRDMAWRSADALLLLGGRPQSQISILQTATGTMSGLEATMPGDPTGFYGKAEEIAYRATDARIAEGSYRFHLKSLVTGADRVIDIPADFSEYMVSSDDAWIAYSTVDETHKPIVGDLRLRSLETGSDRLLIHYTSGAENWNHDPLAFSPDGRYLAYADTQTNKHVMNLKTMESWPLVANPPVDVTFRSWGVAWAPDGSFVLVEGESTPAQRRK